jgi:hypothetical protein
LKSYEQTQEKDEAQFHEMRRDFFVDLADNPETHKLLGDAAMKNTAE